MLKKIRVGGQALIEGVMMLVPGGIGIAVRREDGTIVKEGESYTQWKYRNKIFSFPIIRGMVGFAEMIYIGIKYMEKSLSMYEGRKEEGKGMSFGDIMSIIIAIVLAYFLFFFLPIYLTQFVTGRNNQFMFNIVDGAIKMAFFLIYVWIISLFPDVKRVFQYHGAEHKTVFAYENGKELTVENVKPFSRFHPRCGTSFLVGFIAVIILFFAIVDSLFFGYTSVMPTSLNRFVFHIILLPIVAGIGYEFHLISDKLINIPVLNIIVKSGLWIQHVTTAEPDESQIEVAIESLKEAFKSSGVVYDIEGEVAEYKGEV